MPGAADVAEKLSVMHRSCLFAARSAAITLFHSKAAFPSALWEGVWSVLTHSGAPPWVATGVQALCYASSATIFFSGALSEASFPIARGIMQGRPSSGRSSCTQWHGDYSLWRLILGRLFVHCG